MKKFEKLGKVLSKDEQKNIKGGDCGTGCGENYCAEVTCYNSEHVELGTLYSWRDDSALWIQKCKDCGWSATATTGGYNCNCSSCSV